MREMRRDIIEETAPGAGNIDRTWMTTFWESFSDCVIETDAQFRVTNILKKPESTFMVADIIGMSFPDIAVNKNRALVISELELLKTTDVPYRRFTFLSKLGRYYRWTLVAARENGVFSGVRGIAVDVTIQSLNEITLNWQRAIIEGGNDFVSIADLDGNVLYTNPGAYKMTGYDPASGILTPERVFTSEYLNIVCDVGYTRAVTYGTWTSPGELICADGRLLPIEHSMFCVKNEQDETILIATIIRDITDYVEHEMALEEAREEAEAANVAKSEFLSRMSHEIRTPMNAIIGMISIGLTADDLDKKNYCLIRADAASRHMLNLINDILDMSKIEADKFELSFREFDFEQALKNIANMANVRAEEKQQTFIVNISEGMPAFILSDELRLSQIITNLLTNAIKFTPEHGTITLNVEKLEDIDGDIILRVEISDTGIGIAQDQQDKLFISFNQADPSISQKYGGTGLGLAISKRIVELMGGKIWVESELGKGSSFFFTIKAKKTEGKSRTELSKKISKEKIRILAVDDSEETRNYFVHVMRALDLACDVATGGPQALRMIRYAADIPYNIFFIDWLMPDMDGVELTRRIKKIYGDNSIVIMISANDWNDIEKEAIAAGVKFFISKPLFPSTLINAINICMGADINEPIQVPQQSASACLYDFCNFTLLIAEDVDINREIMSAVLSETNVSIEYAENGKIAVSMFEDNPEKYNLILMDINMPEMDGYEATKQIRSLGHAKARDVPIIAMTANVFKEDIDKCLESGMNDHIGKPIDAETLFKQLSMYLFK